MNYLEERSSVGKTALLMVLAAVCAAAQPATTVYFLEKQPVQGDAELVTLFGRQADPAGGGQKLEIPLVSLLRDTLGDDDPTNDRLRNVWILTSARPTPLQRAASALSFVWFRAGTQRHVNRVPKPVLDLASPSKNVWPNLLANSLQATQFDPLGMLVRSSTRSYRGNFSDYHKLQLFQALGALDALERDPASETLLSDSDFRKLYSRLSLSDRTLGGLVREQSLSKFYEKENEQRQEWRGHNWELLRQRAELGGLYFEPLALPGDTPALALLWVARDDLEHPVDRCFDHQFLNIADPWNDERLQHWTGYSEIRYLDPDNRPVEADTPGARAVGMIPLALYSLDYPRVPLLLADFRDSLKAKRRELFQQGTDTVVTGVLGITRFGNWPFLAAESAWTFVRGRQGAAVNRSARLRAYSEARRFLAVDATLAPNLKSELLSRLDHLALNPLDNNASTEAQLAREQYKALLQYAQSPDGLVARLERDRRKELAAYTHSRGQRMWAAIGRFLSPPPIPHSEAPNAILLAKIDAQRRILYHEHFLERLLNSSPRPEVVWDIDDIRRSVEVLAAESNRDPRIPPLLGQMFARSAEPELRIACLRALQRMNFEQARNELRRLSEDPTTGDSWRALCASYLEGSPDSTPAGAPGGQ